jgi:hypothetical protein
VRAVREALQGVTGGSPLREPEERLLQPYSTPPRLCPPRCTRRVTGEGLREILPPPRALDLEYTQGVVAGEMSQSAIFVLSAPHPLPPMQSPVSVSATQRWRVTVSCIALYDTPLSDLDPTSRPLIPKTRPAPERPPRSLPVTNTASPPGQIPCLGTCLTPRGFVFLFFLPCLVLYYSSSERQHSTGPRLPFGPLALAAALPNTCRRVPHICLDVLSGRAVYRYSVARYVR